MLPGGVASSVQRPAVRRVAVLPLRLHTVSASEEILTGNPELALGVSRLKRPARYHLEMPAPQPPVTLGADNKAPATVVSAPGASRIKSRMVYMQAGITQASNTSLSHIMSGLLGNPGSTHSFLM